jgi:predicted extracellular nuclease
MKKVWTLLVLAITVGVGTHLSYAQTPVPMASTNPYVENFADIANWTNNFAAGIGANRYGAITAGAYPNPTRTTVFSSGTSGGVQKGTGTIQLLATGTTDNTSAAAFDLFLDFTGVNAGTLSLDWAEVNNSTGNRVSTFKIQTNTGAGGAFVDLPTASVSITNNVAASGSFTTIALPAAFNNNAGAKIRFYIANGTGGTTGSRPKVSIDNVTVTATGGGGGVTLNINDVTQGEGNAGTTTFTFTVSLTSAAPAGGVTFDIATADGTTNPANAGSDYTGQTLTNQTIAAGNNSYVFNVSVSGDTTPEANETFFVNVTNVTGATLGDGQGLGTITNDDVALTAIHTIQGSGNSSPLVTQSVTTSGIVTARKSNGYFLQDPNPDADPNTSEALFVFTSVAPSGVAVGDSVQVTGTVAEFVAASSDEPTTPSDPKTATELTSPTNTLINSSGNPLPVAIADTFINTGAANRTAELEKFEYMRVSVSSLTVYEPTNNNFGEFWGVITGVARPFREPGIEAGDPVPNADQGTYAGTPPPNVPRFDQNLERIMVDSDEALNSIGTRRTALLVSTGAVITGIVGPLDYAFDNYRIVLEATATLGVTSGIAAAIPVPARAANEFTISHANLENFGAANTDFAGRLNKASLAVRNVLLTPDVLGVIEVFDLSSLQQLATKINGDVGNPALVNYVAYLDEGVAGGGDDQDVGYLVNSARVSVVGSPTQYHQGTTFTYCGVTDTLHDRPAYVLIVNVPQAGGGNLPVTVILNHTKSLIATDSPLPFGTCGTGTEGARNREKRRLQAEDIANLIATHISENLVVLGDLNAFDFNDGLTDVVGTLKGTPAPENQVVEASTDVWTYQLTNLISTLPADQRYSFAFEGNAQALDHVLVNNAMLSRKTRYQYGRYNGDFDVSFAADTNRPERLSDHDAPVAYFINVAPTAADATVRGRITDGNGVAVEGAVINLNGTQNRKTITDANGNYSFANVETTGFYTVRATRANYSFSPQERSFSQLGNQTEAAFTATAMAVTSNPVDTPEYFVRQHYLDFLGREPEESGFNFWSDQILGCGSDAACVEVKRINVSAAYFLSIEFQTTGGLVDGLYRASFDRAPQYGEFLPDQAAVAKDVVVGRNGWEQQLSTNRQAFLDAFVQRPAFQTVYGGLNNNQYVDTLLTNTRIIWSQAERDALVDGLASGTLTRAAVLGQVAGDQRFVQAKSNKTFVMMEYFGYLRRDPDADGYAYWLNKLNQFNGNFEQAEMVKAFIVSSEFRGRFPR